MRTHNNPADAGLGSLSQAALRTERDAVEITAREIVFHRTVRQSVNVHELAAQVEANEVALAATVSTIRADVASTLAVSMSSMNSQMLSAATAAAGTASTLEANTADALSTSISSMLSSAASTTVFVNAGLSTVNSGLSNVNSGLDAASRARASLNVSVQQAIVAAANAMVPTVYVQWGAKACTAASGAAVIRLCECPSFSSGGRGWLTDAARHKSTAWLRVAVLYTSYRSINFT